VAADTPFDKLRACPEPAEGAGSVRRLWLCPSPSL